MDRIIALGTTCTVALLLTACGTDGTDGAETDATTDAETVAGKGGGDHEDAADDVLAETRGDQPFEVSGTTVTVEGSDTVHLTLQVEGDAPTPCHQVAYEIEESAGERDVRITAVAGEGMCAQVLDPRTVVVPLGEASDLPVIVTVNGEVVGTVDP